MQFDVVWRLPTFIPEALRAEHSWDGQRYYKCPSCETESRFDPVFFRSPPTKCPACQRDCEMVSAVHARQLDVRCNDCGTQQQRLSTEFETLRCEQCMSENVTIRHGDFLPPFPPRFCDALQHDTWGEDCSADLERALEEFHSSASSVPDLPGQMLSSIRFMKRLELFSYADSPHDRCAVINVEANLWRDYFRRSGVFGAGIEALKRFEQALSLADYPLRRAGIAHNVAMAVYSLLARTPESVVALISGIRDVREHGLSAAQAALDGYSTIEGYGARERDMARVHHLMGDLLAAGTDRSDDDIRRAIAHYDQALSLHGSDPRFTPNLQVSMVNAMGKLSNPTQEEQEQAMAFLEAALAVPEVNRIWPEQHTPRMMLGNYYFDLQRFEESRRELEQAAALVLADVENADDELALHARSSEYVPIFSALARVYGVLNRASDALAAMEAVRAATIRWHTRSEDEKRERATRRARNLMSRILGDGSTTPELRLGDQNNAISKVRQELDGTAVVSVDLYVGTLTLVIDAPAQAAGRRVLVESHAVESMDRARFEELMVEYRSGLTEPGPLREQRLNEYFRVADSVLFGPIRRRLGELQITDVLAMVPGPLYGIPIDVESTDGEGMIASPLSVRYVPSLGVAADLVGGRPPGNGRLLIIGYADEDLPGIDEEVRGISEAWGSDVTVMHGSGLTKRSVLDELAKGYEFIHFSCHGSFDEISPERSALHLTRVAENDALRITAADLRTCKLRATSLVTLSACSSGVCSIDAGTDLFGLTGSLLRVGVRAAVGSRWAVYDDFATNFMVALYTELRKAASAPADAFHATRIAFSKTEKLEDWAAFAFTGI